MRMRIHVHVYCSADMVYPLLFYIQVYYQELSVLLSIGMVRYYLLFVRNKFF